MVVSGMGFNASETEKHKHVVRRKGIGINRACTMQVKVGFW